MPSGELQLVINNYDGYNLFLLGDGWDGDRWWMEFNSYEDALFAKAAWENLLYGEQK